MRDLVYETEKQQKEKEWYAVYTIVRHEKAACSRVAKLGLETFLPLRNVTRQWKDRRKKIQAPLFPGYLFAQINAASQEIWRVSNTPGVVRVLGTGPNPDPIPNEQIDALKALMESKLNYTNEAYSQVGRSVTVVNGPLYGIHGKILERRGTYRLILSVDLIRRSVAVEVDVRDVELG